MRGWPLIVLCAAAPLSAQDATSALQRAERTYRGLQSLRAEFTQTLVNPMLGAPEESHGTLFLSPPSRFAMRFTEPEGDRIVADGTWLWAYTPNAMPGQVIRQPIPSHGSTTPNLLAQFVERPLEHYRAYYIGTDTVAGELVDVVRLVPRRDDDPFYEATISIARTSGLVRGLDVQEASAQRRVLVFERLERDVPIPGTEFSFTPPPGTRIVTP